MFPQAERRINAAKRAQRARLGSNIAGRKRCRKGKSCGASCISSSKFCLVDIPWVGQEITKMRNSIRNRPEQKSGPPSFKPVTSRDYLQGMRDAVEEVFNRVKDSDDVVKMDGRVSADKVNWQSGLGKGAEYVASGAFGAFVSIPPENLARGLGSQFPGGVGIKYGDVTANEVNMLRKIGEAGAGPRLIAAKIDNKSDIGMIAMERIPGSTLGKMINSGRISNQDAGEAYLKAMSKLHLAGVAHSDAHFGNIIIQPDGKGKFVDLGWAKDNPRAALTEAINTIRGNSNLDYDNLTGPVAKKIKANLGNVRWKLAANANQTDEEYMKLIQELYEGV